jgi:type VI secretion system protein ImpH
MWETPSNLIAAMLQQGHRLDLFEASRRAAACLALGSADDAGTVQRVVYRNSSDKSFPVGSVRSIIHRQGALEISTSAFGTIGHGGILPSGDWDYFHAASRETELSISQQFLDIFNDRLIKQFVHGWRRNRPDICREVFLRLSNNADSQPWDAGVDWYTPAVLAIAGFALPEKYRSQLFPDTVFAGLLSYMSRPVRSPSGLSRSVGQAFAIGVEVQSFAPDYLQLGFEARTRLASEQGFNLLGQNAVLGETVADYQFRFEIVLGPLDRVHFYDLCPYRDSNSFALLLQFIKSFVGPTLDFDIRYRVEPQSVQPCELGHRMLGFDSWLVDSPSDQSREDPEFRYSWGMESVAA